MESGAWQPGVADGWALPPGRHPVLVLNCARLLRG